MKIKYTQRRMDADADTDLALAMALEEAGHDNSDDDFQAGSSPAISQTLALRNCATKKAKKALNSKDMASPPSEKKPRGGGGGQETPPQRQENTSDGGKKKVRCHNPRRFKRENRATSEEGSKLRDDRPSRQTEQRVLSDHNARLGADRASRRVESPVSSRARINCSKRAPSDEGENAVGVIPSRYLTARNSRIFEEEAVPQTPSGGAVYGGGSALVECERICSNALRIGNERVADGLLDCSRQAEKQAQSDHSGRLESKRKSGLAIDDTGWSLLSSDGSKKVKRSTGVMADASIVSLDQSEESADTGSLEFGQEGCVQDEDDEDLVICTQVQTIPAVPAADFRFSSARYLQNGAEMDAGKMRTHDESPVERKRNIYDILVGNNRREQARVEVSLSAPAVEEVECDQEDEEEFETPGTAMRALVDEADLDYQGLRFLSEEDAKSVDSCECPVCGIDMAGLSVADREQHTDDCLEKREVLCDHDPGDNLPVADCQTEAAVVEGLELLGSTDTAPKSGTLECPVCGVSIDKMSTSERELHTNACLDDAKAEELGEVAEFAPVDAASAALGRPDVRPVVEWLEKLNLGKYAAMFVKEEIDWDTLQWLTEEDLSSLGITALGPRRKIVCALQELKQKGTSTSEVPPNPIAIGVSAVETNQGAKKSITDFFILPPNTGQRLRATDRGVQAGPKAPGTSTGAPTKNRGVQRRPVANSRSIGASSIPPWMCIPGTSFRVDAFKHLTGDCSNWFLTHFHTDHYQGLTRGFRHGRIFCSSVTARLVNLSIGVHWDRLQVIPLDEPVLVDGVRVTFIDANHCPGSVMILFEPPDGKAVLHTGDFRFCSDMAANEAIRACRITTLILDTTYCDPQYDFPKQEAVVQFVIDAIQAEAFNPNTLFLIGTYTIGKERIFLEVGKVLQKFIYVGAAKRRLLECMNLAEEDTKWLTTKDQESHIHVVPLWSIASFKRMGSISRHYHGRYNSIVGFSPTGWSFGRDKKRTPGRPGRRYQQGTIIRYEVPYSEHCSFTELKEFVQTIAPENIIPSVVSSSGQTADGMVAGLLSEES